MRRPKHCLVGLSKWSVWNEARQRFRARHHPPTDVLVCWAIDDNQLIDGCREIPGPERSVRLADVAGL